jgi:hypothetical protein
MKQNGCWHSKYLNSIKKIQVKPNTFANFEVPAKIAHRNFFFAISGVVNQKYLTISCLVIIQYQKMAEKIQINFSNDQKKSSDEQPNINIEVDRGAHFERSSMPTICAIC